MRDGEWGTHNLRRKQGYDLSSHTSMGPKNPVRPTAAYVYCQDTIATSPGRAVYTITAAPSPL